MTEVKNTHGGFREGSGRPIKPIDWARVDFNLMAGSTQEEVAAELGIHRHTLSARFYEEFDLDYSTYSTQKAQAGELHIRVAQFQKALNNNAKGNTQMLIWLGKVRLGQKEPEAMSGAVPEQVNLDKDHRLMQLEHELAVLKGMNANKPETE
jgi:AraC-like DNA-binding protein